jgi:hypothetical protein
VVRGALTRLLEQRLVLSTRRLDSRSCRWTATDSWTSLTFVSNWRRRRSGGRLSGATWHGKAQSYPLFTTSDAFRNGNHRTVRTRCPMPGRSLTPLSISHWRLGCGSPLLMEMRDGPYDAAEIYRHWAKPAGEDGCDVHGEHTAIAEVSVGALVTTDSDVPMRAAVRHLIRDGRADQRPSHCRRIQSLDDVRTRDRRNRAVIPGPALVRERPP